MSRYKIGDKVKVRGDLVINKTYGSDGFVTKMKNFRGKEVTIETVLDRDTDKYRIKELVGYNWTNEMFEGLVKEEIKPKFKVGDTVELILVDDYDTSYGLKIGDRGVISDLPTISTIKHCVLDFENIKSKTIYIDQIKLVEEEAPQSIPSKGTIKYRITDDGITYTTLNGSKIGKSVKSNKDESSNGIGILIAICRMLNIDENKISDIVDILFNNESNSSAKCDNAVIKNDINRALSILDKYKE